MDQNDNDMKRYSKMNLTMTNMLRPEILMTALDSFLVWKLLRYSFYLFLFIPIFPLFFLAFYPPF